MNCSIEHAAKSAFRTYIVLVVFNHQSVLLCVSTYLNLHTVILDCSSHGYSALFFMRLFFIGLRAVILHGPSRGYSAILKQLFYIAFHMVILHCFSHGYSALFFMRLFFIGLRAVILLGPSRG
jgi:hypothetical protein